MRKYLFSMAVLLPVLAIAGAIEDGAPLADNYNLSFRVHQQLTEHKNDQLRPHKFIDDGITFSYYLDELAFIGRANTMDGFRNIFYVTYIRSAPYKAESKNPGRGHRFLLCVTDSGDIKFFGRTDALHSEIELQGNVLQIERNKLDLTTEQGMRYFREIRPL